MNNQALIKPKSLLEELHEKLSPEIKNDVRSELNQKRQLELLRAISSVNLFLQSNFGTGKRPLALEEFELAEAALKEMAEKEVKKLRHRIASFVGLETQWLHYLRFGYFRISRERTPVGRWEDIYALRGHAIDWNRVRMRASRSDSSFPPNSEDLLRQLFQKRYKGAQE